MKYKVTHPKCWLGAIGDLIEIPNPSARALQFLEVVDEPIATADVNPKRQRKTKPQ